MNAACQWLVGVELMKEEPQARLMSQQPENTLFLILPLYPFPVPLHEYLGIYKMSFNLSRSLLMATNGSVIVGFYYG